MATTTHSTAYFRDRNICRKIMKNGTGLAVDYMEVTALQDRLRHHLGLLTAHVWESDTSNVSLARAAWEIEAITDELFNRKEQLKLDL